MKFCRFVSGDSSLPRFGILESDSIMEINSAPWSSEPWKKTSQVFPAAGTRLLAPVAPSKIVCVGRNYAAHAAELGNDVPKEPLIFLKPPNSLVGPGNPIVLTKYSSKIEHEGELGLVVGRRASHLSDSDDALSYLLGYTCVNDVTARDLQKSDVQFTRAKGFDTFCPAGPHIETRRACRVPRERSRSRVRAHITDDFSRGVCRALDFADDDARAWRPDCHGHTFGCRSACFGRQRGSFR